MRIVLNGMTGPVRVRGRDWNLPMPPWRANLDDNQAAVVLTFVRSQLGSNHAGPITPEFVAAARKETHVAPETSDTCCGLRTSEEIVPSRSSAYEFLADIRPKQARVDGRRMPFFRRWPA